MLPEPNYSQEISTALSLKPVQVETILSMIEEGGTILFIARYRKAQEKIDTSAIGEGSTVSGVVRNVVDLGAFVDIGLKNDGLVHVSQIANRFISNPADELEVG